MNTKRKLFFATLAVLASFVAVPSFAEGVALAFDFEDLEAQATAQDEKIERARTVLHDVFSSYCVEKLITASVNIRDNGKPDIEIDTDTKNLKIKFRLAVNEEAYSNWVVSAKIKLSEVADKVEDTDEKYEISDDTIKFDGRKFTFDKRINLGLCRSMFQPSIENMFKFQIIGKEGECLFDSAPRFEYQYTGRSVFPLPEIFTGEMTGEHKPLFINEEVRKPDFLQNIKEIRCNYGRSDHSWYPEMEKKHPVLKVPLKYGVNIDMVYVLDKKDNQSYYCGMLPITWEQAFACGFVKERCYGRGFMRARHHEDRMRNCESSSGTYCLPPTDKVINYLNGLPSTKDLGLEFMIPEEVLWVYTALGGGLSKAPFGRLPNGFEGYCYEPGWIKYSYGEGWLDQYLYDDKAILAQKTPNAYGIHDMVGMWPELCIPKDDGPIEVSPGVRVQRKLGRLGITDLKNQSARQFSSDGSCLSIRLFARKKKGNGSSQEGPQSHDLADLEHQANSGDVSALLQLGNRHFFGDGVKRNYEKAFSLFSKVTELGSAEGCRRLAQCHEFGLGTSKDMLLALKLYEKAASLGDGLAEDWLQRNSSFRERAKGAMDKIDELLENAKKNSAEGFSARGFYIGMPVEDAKFLLRQYLPDVEIREYLSVNEIASDFSQRNIYFGIPLTHMMAELEHQFNERHKIKVKEQYALTNGLWLAREHQAFCRTDNSGKVVLFNFLGEALESILNIKCEDETKLAQAFTEHFGGTVESNTMEASLINFGIGDAPSIPVKQSIWKVRRTDGVDITIFGRETLPSEVSIQDNMLLLAKIPYINGKGARKGTLRIERTH